MALMRTFYDFDFDEKRPQLEEESRMMETTNDVVDAKKKINKKKKKKNRRHPAESSSTPSPDILLRSGGELLSRVRDFHQSTPISRDGLEQRSQFDLRPHSLDGHQQKNKLEKICVASLRASVTKKSTAILKRFLLLFLAHLSRNYTQNEAH